jgi:uncharacterized SAM-binding protein YcdF (DUF218 family)
MFFFLSKTVAFLFMPLTIVIIFLLLAVFVKRPHLKKTFSWIGLGLLLFFCNDFIANEAMSMWELPAKPYAITKKYKLAIVLTGTTITKPYPNDRVYFNKGADRVTHTVELHKRGLAEKILISGGSGRILEANDEPEANKFRKAMIMMGVDSSAIIIENETRNTYESAVAVRPLLDSMNYKAEECVLVTSAFHLRRSLAVYRKAGLDLDYFSTDFYSHPREYHIDALLLPHVEAMLIWQKLFKEWLGLAAYKVAGYV